MAPILEDMVSAVNCFCRIVHEFSFLDAAAGNHTGNNDWRCAYDVGALVFPDSLCVCINDKNRSSCRDNVENRGVSGNKIFAEILLYAFVDGSVSGGRMAVDTGHAGGAFVGSCFAGGYSRESAGKRV